MADKRVAVLGSTGSVGTQALDVVRRHRDRLEVAALAAGGNVTLLAEQVREHRPELVSVASESSAAALRETLGTDAPRIVHGTSGLLAATTEVDAAVVLNAVVGAAGLAATHAAVSRGIDVALANKESLVMAGELIMAAAAVSGSAILPVDSEPNALHQCLRGTRIDDVHRLVLTASGGPFRGWTAEQLEEVTPERALQHPTWSMGPRITIDSATLMNKGFEVIETHWLFGLPVDKIDVVVHPQSIVHSLVELVDGSLIAHAGPTDMRLPIQDALSYPERWQRTVEPLDLPQSAPWTFEPAGPERHPALALAYRALELGGSAPAIVNAADEVAVAAFLAHSLPFQSIVPLVGEVLEACSVPPADSLDAVLAADAAARAETERLLARHTS
ncbi:MAG: 1-deoxy-D-xylulose-5-phosphate reductoisomerase [Acidobacteriota bacterium]|jgi:1-deoxy-D-xylulose-5-phosphate reductoisomerase